MTIAPTPHDSAFSAKLDELRILLADLAKAAPAAAVETFDVLKDKAAAVCDNCEKKVTDATHTVVKTVKEHPVQTALVVVGAGLLAWWLLRRNACKCD